MKAVLEIRPAPGAYQHLLLAVDSSPHSEAATLEAVRLARLWGAELTGLHAYAAKLHDRRFRQMEGSLPAQFQREKELNRQRRVHDSLITRGLHMISDSYLDGTERACGAAGVRFTRRGLEGKNYRVILDEVTQSGHDLLVLGRQGLGALRRGAPGSVCSRVTRMTTVDTLVIALDASPIGDGPLVVGVDGSARGFAAVLSAARLALALGAPLHLVAVYDPHFHTVAFERIGEVINERAGRVFKLREQEKLHSEIIDTGLAKIYQAHLDVARRVAAGEGVEAEALLLEGKPHDAIRGHAEEVGASLLAVGKLGIHADPGLDIGGNTEQLLLWGGTHMLLTSRTHVPDEELLADETIRWTDEAEARLERIPSFVRVMVRRAILRWAADRGHTVITQSIVEQASAELRPR